MGLVHTSEMSRQNRLFLLVMRTSTKGKDQFSSLCRCVYAVHVMWLLFQIMSACSNIEITSFLRLCRYVGLLYLHSIYHFVVKVLFGRRLTSNVCTHVYPAANIRVWQNIEKSLLWAFATL